MQGFIQTITGCISSLANVKLLTTPSSPFTILLSEEKSIVFHLVDLETYVQWSAEHDCSTFFSDLSTQFELQELQLIHVWEDVWSLRKGLVEARIASLLGEFTRYHARQTVVKKITKPTLIDFLTQHHLQAPINGRYKYGLYKGEELLAVASFSAGRPMDRDGNMYNSYELLRFANKTGSVVAGGLSKLMSYFIKEQNPDDIMTYVDRDWGSGKGYRQLGFEQVGLLPPQLFLLGLNTNERYYEHRVAEEKNTSNDYLYVYNSGSYKYIKDLKQK
jgi:hypothetical protein